MTKFRSGNGAPWLDLLATLGGRYRARTVDALASPALLREWLRQHGLEPTGAVTEDDLASARGLREALHRVAAASLRGDAPVPADRRAIAGALAADEPRRWCSDQTCGNRLRVRAHRARIQPA